MLVNASSLKSDCIVLINLSNNETGARRITVAENLTLKDLGLTSFEQAKAPDSAALTKAMTDVSKDAYMSPEQKQAKLNALVEKFKLDQAAYAAQGGTMIQDRIAIAACDWLVANRGFSKTDGGANTKVVKPSDLQVSTIQTGSGLLFSVTGTSVWG